jgi:TRAP-type mannitol/chloroaromatic compound transport system substrate-binding protein
LTSIVVWKSVIELTNTLYETAQKNSQQAVQVTNGNFDAAAVAASPGTTVQDCVSTNVVSVQETTLLSEIANVSLPLSYARA